MKRLLLLTAFCVSSTTSDAAEPGALMIVGGGGTPDVVIAEAVRLAGGQQANVVILPQASSAENRGTSSAEMFRQHKVTNVKVIELDSPAAARAAIAAADLIWFPGGQQSKLMDALVAAEIDSLIIKRHCDGAVIGGTSAGAAVMAADMIPRAPKKAALRAGNTPIAKGLGLADSLIIDQHFVERNRMNRLLSAVLDRPNRVGVGIGEKTAIVVRGQRFKVLGEGSVIVVDARKAEVGSPDTGKLQTGRGMILHVLATGDEFQLNK